MIDPSTKHGTPSVRVSLEQEMRITVFSDEVIIEYLRDRGYCIDGERKLPVVVTREVLVDDAGNEVCAIDGATMEAVGRLALAGLTSDARDLVLQVVAKHLGRAKL